MAIPIDRFAQGALRPQLQHLRTTIRTHYPDFTLPSIYVMTGPLTPLGHAVNIPQHSAPPGMRPGIYLSQELIQRLTPEQTIAVIAHEIGHNFVDRYAPPQIPPGTSSNYALFLNRGVECAADHFAVRMTGNPQAKIGALRASEQLTQPPELMVDPDRYKVSSHPRISQRIRMLENTLDLPTERLRFDASCEVIDIVPPSVPSQIRPRQSLPKN